MIRIYTIFFALLFFITGCEDPSGKKSEPTREELIFTKHAKCRMDCRHISEDEIREIISNGRKNGSKSNVNGKPCPTIALEGRTSDDQDVRIIIAECEPVRKIVTVIDLGTDWKCNCK